MAITLVQLWQQQSDIYDADQTAAQNDLAVAQFELTTAKTTLDTDVAALSKLDGEIAANRAKLATTAAPSEVTALNNTIRDQIIKHHGLEGGILDDQEAVATAESDAKAAGAALKRATGRLGENAVKLAAAKEASTQRQLLKVQLAAPPFDTIQNDAKAALRDAKPSILADAQAELAVNMTPALLKIAGLRHATRSSRPVNLRQAVLDAEDALGQALLGTSGVAGTAAQKAIVFRHAEQALRDYAKTAKPRYDRAIAVLADLQAMGAGAKTPDLLTAQEKLDVASNEARTKAETEAESVDTALRGLYAARVHLDADIVAKIVGDAIGNPTTAPPAPEKPGAPAVAEKAPPVTYKAAEPTTGKAADATPGKAADSTEKPPSVNEARDALKKTQDKLVADGDKKVLDEWQVVVPDSAWRAVIDYLDAIGALTELQATAPAGLVEATVKAEDEYAAALAAAAKAQRQADALTDVVSVRVDRVAASAAALPGRLLSAVRGDSF